MKDLCLNYRIGPSTDSLRLVPSPFFLEAGDDLKTHGREETRTLHGRKDG